MAVVNSYAQTGDLEDSWWGAFHLFPPTPLKVAFFLHFILTIIL